MSVPDPIRTPPVRRARRAPVLVACTIGLLLSFGFAYGAWVLASDHLHMVAVGRTTDGTIVGYQTVRHTGTRGRYLSTTYHPTFRYRIDDARTVEGTTLESLELEEIQVGRVMRVVYDPAQPTAVRLAAALDAGLSIDVWLLGGAALLMSTASAIGLWRRRAA